MLAGVWGWGRSGAAFRVGCAAAARRRDAAALASARKLLAADAKDADVLASFAISLAGQKKWDEAFAKAGGVLRGLPSPDDAAFYTSGRTSNEAAFLYQLLGRMFGTNNFPDCSNMCHESSGLGLMQSIGIGKAMTEFLAKNASLAATPDGSSTP